MELKILKKVVPFSKIYINSHIRYWEDAVVNGEKDNPGEPRIPMCMWDSDFGELRWKPVIDVDNGVILDWPEGVEARVHYKVCDEFECTIPELGYFKYSGYVPEFMSPSRENYGDYIILNIDKTGKIESWDIDKVKEFIKEEIKING